MTAQPYTDRHYDWKHSLELRNSLDNWRFQAAIIGSEFVP